MLDINKGKAYSRNSKWLNIIRRQSMAGERGERSMEETAMKTGKHFILWVIRSC